MQNFFQFSLHSNGHKFFFSVHFPSFFFGLFSTELRERGGLLIFMMIIDSIENLSLFASFYAHFEGIKNFMKSINIFFLLEGDFWLENFFFIASQKSGRILLRKYYQSRALRISFLCLHNSCSIFSLSNAYK